MVLPTCRAHLALYCAFLLVTNSVARAAEPPIMMADFEGLDFRAWVIEGEAFGATPAQGTLRGQMPVSNFFGKGLANSFHGGDQATGTLTSPELKIDRAYLSFFIGGGGWAGKTCLNLLVDGHVVRTVVVYADRSTTEIFADGGMVYMPIPSLLPSGGRLVELTATGSPVQVHRFEATPLKSIWKR